MTRLDADGSPIYRGQPGYGCSDPPAGMSERYAEESRTIDLFGVPDMQIKATDKGTEEPSDE